MAEGTFTIEELGKLGVPGAALPAGAARFEWTADRRPADIAKGGAYCAPRGEWNLGGKMRSVRTDYPGAKSPSEQVLGGSREPFTIEGKFDDRYNFPGFAVQEMRRVEALCLRGHLCRFQFQGQVFHGLITEWSFPYKREWDIGYRLTVSVHERPEEADIIRALPITPSLDLQVNDMALAQLQMLEVARSAPISAISGSLVQDVLDAMATVMEVGDEVAKTVEATMSDGTTAERFTRVATQLRSVAATSQAASVLTVGARSDIDLAVRTALTVLQFEEWQRSLRYRARLLTKDSRRAALQTDERVRPSADRVYRPQAGESLYSIANRFYGDPHAWRIIADRNHLHVFIMVGTEILVLPDRGAQ